MKNKTCAGKAIMVIDGTKVMVRGLTSSNARVAGKNGTFIGNGACQPVCSHGIYAGHIKLHRVERSRFFNQHEGDRTRSHGNSTEVIGCDIADGPTGNSSYLIEIPNGGAVLIAANRMRKGRKSSNGGTAISIGGEAEINPPGPIVIRDNNFVNE